MSLKAKLEAVIYAAEEPVTLAQLAALFTADALEWKAEQAAVSAEIAAEASLNSATEPVHLLAREFDYLEIDTSAPVDLGTDQAPSAAANEEQAEPAKADTPTDAEVTPQADPVPEQEAAQDEASVTEPQPEHGLPVAEAATEPEVRRLARLRDREVRGIIRKLLDELVADYATDDRGIEIREIAGGFRMATKPECHDAVRAFVKSLKPVLKLSLPALETLAVIAYKQPVTAPEVNEIRGVDSSGVFGSLLARKLIATAGRKQVIGRPILYKTTREFLLRFGLKDVAELPSMEEFEKMAAIELDEPEPTSGGGPASAPTLNLSDELDETEGEQPEDELRELELETSQSTETDATSASHEPPTPAEAAPAAPPSIEQAETENSHHGQETRQE